MILDFFQYLRDRITGKAEPGDKRNTSWRKIRLAHLEKNPRCFICDSSKSVEVHHIIPYNLAPDLELDSNNLMSLCESKKYGINCHLLVGHLGNYRRINPSVIVDATTWKLKLGK